jgi:hypothetical protein
MVTQVPRHKAGIRIVSPTKCRRNDHIDSRRAEKVLDRVSKRRSRHGRYYGENRDNLNENSPEHAPQ